MNEAKKAPLHLSEVLAKKEGLKVTGLSDVDQHKPYNIKLQKDIKEETQGLMKIYNDCNGDYQKIYNTIDPKYGVKLDLLQQYAPKTANEFAWQCQEGNYHIGESAGLLKK